MDEVSKRVDHCVGMDSNGESCGNLKRCVL